MILKNIFLFLLCFVVSISAWADMYVYCPPNKAISCKNDKCQIDRKYSDDWKIGLIESKALHYSFASSGVKTQEQYATCYYTSAVGAGIKLYSKHSLRAAPEVAGNKWQNWYDQWLCYANNIATCPLATKEER